MQLQPGEESGEATIALEVLEVEVARQVLDVRVPQFYRMAIEPPQTNLPVAMVTLFVFGFTISPAYYLPMSIFSIAFGGKHSGFLIALIDVFGYVGSLVFTFFGGSIARDFGWPVFLMVLLTITVLALVTVTAFLYMDYRATNRSRT